MWRRGVLVACVVLAGCPIGQNRIDRRTSDLCPGITGFEALGWDYYNGVPVTDPVLPPPSPVGGVYGHTDFPLLGFAYPAGWTPFEIRTVDVMGVDLVRDDNRALWRYVAVTFSGVADVDAVLDFELGLTMDFFGMTGVDVVCERADTVEQAPGTGIVTSFHNVLVRGDGQTALLATNVTPLPGLPSSMAFVRVLSAPTGEFGDRVYDTFMAIDWQMLVGDSDSVSSDRDHDGWLDEFDAFPDDPTRH